MQVGVKKPAVGIHSRTHSEASPSLADKRQCRAPVGKPLGRASSLGKEAVLIVNEDSADDKDGSRPQGQGGLRAKRPYEEPGLSMR